MKDVNVKVFVEIQSGRYDLSIGTYDIAPFEIGKYPVVNRWFGEFVSGKGYGNSDLWTADGIKWFNAETKQPYYRQDDKWNKPDCPVVGVCLYEAEAFCSWLTQTQSDGYTYRLPTEMEWEAAAAGFEKRVYPWGDDWDKSRCNTSEAGINRTSAVGIFESGNTPEGVCDMAGNVWEWTNSKKEVGSLVLRGGSWADSIIDDAAYVARCNDRCWTFPNYRDYDAGFRCVRTKSEHSLKEEKMKDTKKNETHDGNNIG